MWFWGLVKLGFKMIGVFFLIMFCFLCSVGLLVAGYKQGADSSSRDIAELLFAENKEELRLTQDYHGEPGYKGYDYTTKCGDTLYSPLPNVGVVTYVGTDGWVGPYSTGEENTMIVIEGDAGSVTLFHGRYFVKPGDTVIGGRTPIGENARVGNATGCHAHIIWKPSEQHIRYYTAKTPLVISNYKPEQGGPNCDNDCSTMASGDKVASWRLGKNGVLAAACPAQWPFGTQFNVEGQIYECRDRGGWINCLGEGQYDPAYSNFYNRDYYADTDYCWVDLLGDSGMSYGSRTTNWGFIK